MPTKQLVIRRRALRHLAIVALAGALIFCYLLYRSATAQSTMLLRLWHDQDATGTVSADDMPAGGVEVSVTEQCAGNVCAASPRGYVAVTDANGYVSLELQADTQYSIAAPCMTLTVQASEVSGQAAQEMTTCAVWRLWLPALAR